MSILLKTQKMLWGRAAGRCSLSECREELFEDATETDDSVLVGENCHIVAESDGGPRADLAVPMERRNRYANLILLCRNHHKIIDEQVGEYTVERLHSIKQEHEDWVKTQLDLFDSAKQFDDEQYADMIDTWERLAHVDKWRAWSSHVLGAGPPCMSKELDRDLEELRGWLLNRVWPRRYPGLDNAFQNFRLVLEGFQETFRKHAEEVAGNELRTRQFYKIPEWDEERYELLSKRFDFHVDLVDDLMTELSRAANLICDRVRQYLKRSYRLREGRLVIQTGPFLDFSFKNILVQYSEQERSPDIPYPGLQTFLDERRKRAMHFGEGTAP